MTDEDLRNQFTAYMQKVIEHAKIDYIRRKAAQEKRKAQLEFEVKANPELYTLVEELNANAEED